MLDALPRATKGDHSEPLIFLASRPGKPRTSGDEKALAISAIGGLPGVKLLAPVEANGLFVEIPPPAQAALREKGWRFYTFLGETGCRLMCAWDTRPETVDQFALDLREASRAG